jgi:hypothetical protein
MFDEIDKNNNNKIKTNKEYNLSSPKIIQNDDIENDRIVLTIEERIDESELILDGIKFKGIEDIVKDKNFLKLKSLKDNKPALTRLSKDLKSKSPQFYE